MSRSDGTRIELCGRFGLELLGKRLDDALPGHQGQLLFAYLALNRDRPAGRDELIDLLWPHGPPRDPAGTLTALLSKLRRALGPGVLEGRGQLTLQLPGDAEVDLEEAQRAAAAGEAALGRSEWREAWDAGSAAEAIASRGFALRQDSPWIEERRRDLEALLLRALDCISDAGRHLGGSELTGAERAARTAIERAPFRETGHRLLMEALAARGNVAEALRAYENVRLLLRDELGTHPSAPLQALHQRLLTEGPAAPSEEPAEQPLPPAAEERKVLTVLAVGLIGGGSGDPERMRALLDRVLGEVTAEIDDAGGTLGAMIGGSLFAAFGAPVAQEDHAERALRAALGIRRRIGKAFGDALALRIGVDTGETVVQPPGDGALAVTGAPVMAALQLLGAAGPDEILAGEPTVAAARGTFEFGAPRAAGRPLERALSLTGSRTRFRTPFVGRADEFELLRANFRRVVEQRSCHFVTVVGDAGVGKTRLLREFWDWLATRSPQPLRRTGRCLAYGRGVTYRPLADVLREELSLLETDPPETIGLRLGSHQILGLTLGLDLVPGLHPLNVRDRLEEAWVAFFDERLSERPAAVLIEDLHWAQDPLLDLLERLTREVRGPLLLIATARPEFIDRRPAWSTIWLDPLADEETDRMLAQMEHADVPDEVRSSVVRRAEGNPFFAEEMLARLADQGALSSASGLPVPESVQAVLAARIDLLPPTEKAALQVASVIGRVFWRGPVQELLEGVMPDFPLLELRDFVRRRSTSSLAGEREYAFVHALTRDVTYASLPRGRRARLHAGFAELLERTVAGRDEHAAFLAHHYYEAVRVEDADLAWEANREELERLRQKALAWLRRASELAVGRYELDEAIVLLEHALALDPPETERSQLWRAIGRANALKFDGQAFWAAMETAARLAPDDATRAEIVSQLAVEAFVRAGMWTETPAIEEIGEWVAQALQLAEPGTASRARALIAEASLDLEAGEAAAEAATIAEALDDPELCVYAWDACGTVAMVAGDYEAAWRWRTRRLDLLDRVDDPDLRTIIGETPYAACVATCRFEQARDIARLHDELTSGLTPHHRLHGAAILGEVEELLGDWAAIRAQEARVRDAVAANASSPCLRNARSLLVCALAAACLGDERRASALEREAEALGLMGRQVLDAPRLRLALLRGDLDLAEELLAGLLDQRGWYARGHGTSLATLTTRIDALAALGHRERVEAEAVPLLQPGTFVEPFALRALGVVRGDETLVEQAVDRFDRCGLVWHASQTRALVVR